MNKRRMTRTKKRIVGSGKYKPNNKPKKNGASSRRKHNRSASYQHYSKGSIEPEQSEKMKQLKFTKLLQSSKYNLTPEQIATSRLRRAMVTSHMGNYVSRRPPRPRSPREPSPPRPPLNLSSLNDALPPS